MAFVQRLHRHWRTGLALQLRAMALLLGPSDTISLEDLESARRDAREALALDDIPPHFTEGAQLLLSLLDVVGNQGELGEELRRRRGEEGQLTGDLRGLCACLLQSDRHLSAGGDPLDKPLRRARGASPVFLQRARAQHPSELACGARELPQTPVWKRATHLLRVGRGLWGVHGLHDGDRDGR